MRRRTEVCILRLQIRTPKQDKQELFRQAQVKIRTSGHRLQIRTQGTRSSTRERGIGGSKGSPLFISYS